MYLHYIFHIEKQFIWSFIATNPVKTNASLLFTLAKFQVFCSDADDHHTKAATCQKRRSWVGRVVGRVGMCPPTFSFTFIEKENFPTHCLLPVEYFLILPTQFAEAYNAPVYCCCAILVTATVPPLPARATAPPPPLHTPRRCRVYAPTCNSPHIISEQFSEYYILR